jgi:hypothetical protein
MSAQKFYVIDCFFASRQHQAINLNRQIRNLSLRLFRRMREFFRRGDARRDARVARKRE